MRSWCQTAQREGAERCSLPRCPQHRSQALSSFSGKVSGEPWYAVAIELDRHVEEEVGDEVGEKVGEEAQQVEGAEHIQKLPLGGDKVAVPGGTTRRKHP